MPPSRPAPLTSPLNLLSEDEFATTWTITVTADSFAFFQEQCDLGATDFCNVGIPGFTPTGLTNFLDYLNDLLAYVHAMANALDYYERVIERIDDHYKTQRRDEDD